MQLGDRALALACHNLWVPSPLLKKQTKQTKSWAWWCPPIISAFRGLKQEEKEEDGRKGRRRDEDGGEEARDRGRDGRERVSCGTRNVYVVSHSSYGTVRHTMSW